MSKYDMGFRNLWNRINQVSPGITPINKLSNKAVLALVIEFFENPRMSQGTKDAEVIYKDIINGIAVPEDPEDPEERPIGEAKEAKEAKEEEEGPAMQYSNIPLKSIYDITIKYMNTIIQDSLRYPEDYPDDFYKGPPGKKPIDLYMKILQQRDKERKNDWYNRLRNLESDNPATQKLYDNLNQDINVYMQRPYKISEEYIGKKTNRINKPRKK